MKLIISPYNDIFSNLVIENNLFRKWEKLSDADRESEPDVLFLYVNKPCVVLGRFQNPWKELHWPSIKSSKCTVARRQSGGGTVYQDMGNLNFSFITGKREINKESNLDRIRSFFHRNWKIKMSRSADFGLFINKDDGEFKVSGNAFKQGRVSSIHHGTLLINSALNNLGGALERLPLEIETKAVNSNPKRVMNIAELDTELTIDSCLDMFKAEYSSLDIDLDEILNEKSSIEYMAQLKSDKWVYCETPKFRMTEKFDFAWGKVKVKIDVRKGIIHTMHLSSNKVKTDWSLWESILEGKAIYEQTTYRILMDEIKKIEDAELKEFLQVFFAWMLMSWGK